MQLSQEWDKKFALSDKVEHRKVSFKNRYGFELAADLYLPKNRAEKSPTVVVSGPFGAVKEQSSGVYAHQLATLGFVTIAFDPSTTGESDDKGFRNLASPDMFTEDFLAAVDYMGVQPYVDRNRIGVLGICGFGGFALNAAIIDSRVKAVATSVMYDMSRFIGQGAGDSFTKAQRRAIVKHLSEQRWKDIENGSQRLGNHGISFDEQGNLVQAETFLPKELPANPHPVLKEFYDYYRLEPGFHPRSGNSTSAFTATSSLAFMNAPLMAHIDEIDRPVLLISGTEAHSLFYSEDAYKALQTEKELVVVPGANHCDLYYKTDLIPFDKLEAFFKKNL